MLLPLKAINFQNTPSGKVHYFIELCNTYGLEKNQISV